MKMKTRSAEIARRAIQTVVTTPGCNKKQIHQHELDISTSANNRIYDHRVLSVA
jgi:hypothetical protein